MKRKLILGALLLWGIAMSLSWCTERVESAQGWTSTIEVNGDPSFQDAIHRALDKVDEAGYGRFVYLNIECIEPAMKYPSVGGYIIFGESTRGTVCINPVFVYKADWVAGMIVEEACHNSMKNNRHNPCGQKAEYACGWVRQIFGECINAPESLHRARHWDEIPDTLCLEENR